ncbi:MAG: hypothetical protein JWO13_156 [Acidobacteriales bacterium]|nr:hypothetical protein [Terriglobales bacterium]
MNTYATLVPCSEEMVNTCSEHLNQSFGVTLMGNAEVIGLGKLFNQRL